MKKLAGKIATLDQEDISRLEADGELKFPVEGEEVVITQDDVEIISEDIPGWQVANLGNLTVALDVTITPELWQEGIARELINRIQNLRKEKGFDVTDYIEVVLQDHPEITEAINQNITYICTEILAREFNVVNRIDTENKDSIELTDTISSWISIRKVEQN